MTKLEKALSEYHEKFKKNYPLVITSNVSDDDVIKDINRCIRMNKIADEPKYDDELEY